MMRLLHWNDITTYEHNNDGTNSDGAEDARLNRRMLGGCCALSAHASVSPSCTSVSFVMQTRGASFYELCMRAMSD